MSPDLAFLPDLATLAPFLAAALALNLTPGADMTYVIARSVAQGRPAGVSSSLGIAAGSLVHSLLAAVGVSAVLQHSELAFQVIKWAGAAYLLFLAWKALRSAGQGPDAAARPPASQSRMFIEGMLTNLLNPKVALFILAFLPQFVDPAKGNVAAQVLFLGLLFNIGGTAVNLAVAWSTGAARGLVNGSPRFAAAMRRLSALVFVWLAIRLAVSERAAP